MKISNLITKSNLSSYTNILPVDVIARIKEIIRTSDKYNLNTNIYLEPCDLNKVEYLNKYSCGFKEGLILHNNEDGSIYFFNN